VTAYRLVADPRVDLDVAAAYHWYETETPGLGAEFLDELIAAYDRIAARPLQYQDLRSGVRRALLRRFPYAVYFAVERDVIVVLAVLHASRDPAEWQRRGKSWDP
jgi:plasmid stabilization system protein ParE